MQSQARTIRLFIYKAKSIFSLKELLRHVLKIAENALLNFGPTYIWEVKKYV